jgi:hypothetical protein
MTSEETEDVMYAVMVVVSRVYISETVIDICSHELLASNKSNYQSKPLVWSLICDNIYC